MRRSGSSASCPPGWRGLRRGPRTSPAWPATPPRRSGSSSDSDHLAVTERALVEKVIPPDFRYPTADGRLALARPFALTSRYDEALSWFAESRRVLTEDGARSLLAIADYDEALMYARRGRPDDPGLAQPLLERTRRQFEEIGMPGWIRRADQLSRELGV